MLHLRMTALDRLNDQQKGNPSSHVTIYPFLRALIMLHQPVVRGHGSPEAGRDLKKPRCHLVMATWAISRLNGIILNRAGLNVCHEGKNGILHRRRFPSL